jgi:hypothetical protein
MNVILSFPAIEFNRSCSQPRSSGMGTMAKAETGCWPGLKWTFPKADFHVQLTDMLEKIIKMERDAFGINLATPEESAPSSVEAFIAGMKRSALPVVQEVDHDDSL